MNGIIYKAENVITHKSYIGQTIRSLKARKYEHYYSSDKVKTYFYRALLKYPKENWAWSVECDIEAPTQILLKEYLNMAENMFIEQEGTLVPNGYNLTLGGDGDLGYHPSKETREKIKNSEKGKFISEETRKKISEVKKGKHLSEETKKKISETTKGHFVSIETRQKISETNKGRIFSEEHKQKISKALSGEKNPMYGIHRKLSEEHKQKISLANKEFWRKKKNENI